MNTRESVSRKPAPPKARGSSLPAPREASQMPVRILSAVLALLTAAPIVAGTIRGEVRDAGGAPLADAVVYAVPIGRDVPSPRGRALPRGLMDQKDRRFIPHVLVVQKGTAVDFPNSDDVQHHVYSFSEAKTFQLPLYKGNPGKPVVFDNAGVVTLGCNIHDRMSAFIVVVDTPYFAKSAASGAIALKSVPAGRYRLHLWYPDIQREVPPVTIEVSQGQHDVHFSPSGIRIGREHVRP